MTKKRRVIAGALIALVGVIGLWFGAFRSNEPRYNGKTVSEWLATPDELKYEPPTVITRPSGLREIKGRISSELPNNPRIREMLDALGSNAVPALLKQLRESESTRTRILLSIARSTSVPASVSAFATTNLIDPMLRIARAAEALRFLGTDAACGIPELERLAGSGRLHFGSYHAIIILGKLGSDGWKALGRVITNATPATRNALRIPLQAACGSALTSGNLRKREEAAVVLCLLDSPPHLVIPVLSDVVINSNDAARQERALRGLAKLAPDYVTAHDAIKKATKSDYSEIRSLAQSILNSINQTNTTAKR